MEEGGREKPGDRQSYGACGRQSRFASSSVRRQKEPEGGKERSYPVYGFRLYPENNGDSTKALRVQRERLKVLLWWRGLGSTVSI